MQLFNYNVTTNQLINMGAQKCLTADVEGRSLKFSDCNDSRKTQKWTWSGFTNETMLKNWEISGKQYKWIVFVQSSYFNEFKKFIKFSYFMSTWYCQVKNYLQPKDALCAKMNFKKWNSHKKISWLSELLLKTKKLSSILKFIFGSQRNHKLSQEPSLLGWSWRSYASSFQIWIAAKLSIARKPFFCICQA